MGNLLPDFPNDTSVKRAGQLRGRGDQVASPNGPAPEGERPDGSFDMLLPLARRNVAL